MLPSMRRRLRAASAAAAAVLLGAAAAAGADLVQDFIRRHWRHPLAPQGPPPARLSPLEASLHPESCGTCHRRGPRRTANPPGARRRAPHAIHGLRARAPSQLARGSQLESGSFRSTNSRRRAGGALRQAPPASRGGALHEPGALEAESGAVGARVGRAGEPSRIDTNELSVAHQVAPAVDDLDFVAALAQRLA